MRNRDRQIKKEQDAKLTDHSSDTLMLNPIVIRIICHFFSLLLLHFVVTFDYMATASMHKSMEKMVKQSNELAAIFFRPVAFFFLF